MKTPATPYGTLPPASTPSTRKPMSLPRLREMHASGEKITMLTAYDATFAAVADAAGVDCILVGDSLGMVCQGLTSTVGVSLETMRHHIECVANGLRRSQATAWLIGDLPFGTYHESREQALRSAVVLMQAGAHMVKREGGGLDDRGGAFSGRARHSCLRAPGPDTANGSRIGRLPGAGQNRRSRCQTKA